MLGGVELGAMKRLGCVVYVSITVEEKSFRIKDTK